VARLGQPTIELSHKPRGSGGVWFPLEQDQPLRYIERGLADSFNGALSPLLPSLSLPLCAMRDGFG
jgi:hypothetical protein